MRAFISPLYDYQSSVYRFRLNDFGPGWSVEGLKKAKTTETVRKCPERESQLTKQLAGSRAPQLRAQLLGTLTGLARDTWWKASQCHGVPHGTVRARDSCGSLHLVLWFLDRADSSRVTLCTSRENSFGERRGQGLKNKSAQNGTKPTKNPQIGLSPHNNHILSFKHTHFLCLTKAFTSLLSYQKVHASVVNKHVIAACFL